MSYSDYGPSPYGPHGPQYSHPQGTTILVLGILSLVVCTFIGPFAWSLGSRALREIDESGHFYENRGYVQAGRICGIVSTVMMGLTLLLLIVVFFIAMISESMS